MKSPIWLAASALLLTAPLGLSKTELETLRSLCNEQERQIHQLEEENAHLRAMTGEKAKPQREVPGLVSNPNVRSRPSSSVSAKASYTIRSGDTLAAIARKNGTTVDAIAKANGIKNAGLISVGQIITIPGAETSASQEVASTPAPKATTSSSAGDDIYVIQPGETFYSIAKGHGMSTKDLMDANPGIKASELRTGQKLHLGKRRAEARAWAKADKPAPTAEKSSPASKGNTANNEPKPSAGKSTGSQPTIRSIIVNSEMTYGQFADKHGTDVARLNDLNGLEFPDAVLLAKGSELFIPAQP